MTNSLALVPSGAETEGQSVPRVPRIRDTYLGELLGYERPRKVRELIERHIADLPGILRRPTVGRLENAGNLPDTYTVNEYELTIGEAAFIVGASEAPNKGPIMQALAEEFDRLAGGAAMTPEAVALLASRVAAETALAVVAGRGPRRRGKGPPGQLDFFEAFAGRVVTGLSVPGTALAERVLDAVTNHSLASINAIQRVVQARRSTLCAVVRQLEAEGRLGRVEGVFRAVGRA